MFYSRIIQLLRFLPHSVDGMERYADAIRQKVHEAVRTGKIPHQRKRECPVFLGWTGSGWKDWLNRADQKEAQMKEISALDGAACSYAERENGYIFVVQTAGKRIAKRDV